MNERITQLERELDGLHGYFEVLDEHDHEEIDRVAERINEIEEALDRLLSYRPNAQEVEEGGDDPTWAFFNSAEKRAAMLDKVAGREDQVLRAVNESLGDDAA
jgi:Asp-tRNA(Asn)/Glu-tRNA(Gln) amidotransferase C subunit